MIDEYKMIKSDRIDGHIDRLRLIKELSIRIAEEILLDDINLSADEVEIVLSQLKVDLTVMAQPSPVEEAFKNSKARMKVISELGKEINY